MSGWKWPQHMCDKDPGENPEELVAGTLPCSANSRPGDRPGRGAGD